MTHSIRRVVTGFDADGRSVILTDDVLQADLQKWGPGMPHWPLLWGADSVPAIVPVNGTPDSAPTDWPPPGGVRVRILERNPGYGIPQNAVPTAIKDLDPSSAMHRTDTIDILLILSGEVGIEQDDGVETILRAGDVMIIQGTRHAWKPRGECRFAAIVIGAEAPAVAL